MHICGGALVGHVSVMHIKGVGLISVRDERADEVGERTDTRMVEG